MNVLFTNNEKPLSRLIRAVTGEESSHCAIRIGDFVLHSTLFGPEIRTYEYFKAHNHIVASVPTSTPDSAAVALATSLDSAGYDYFALAYLGLRYALKLLGVNIPKANLWNVSGMYLCTELVSRAVLGAEDPNITPHQLYLKLSGLACG